MNDKEYAEQYILPDGRSLAEHRKEKDAQRLNEWGELVLPCIVEGDEEERALKEACFTWMMTSVERDDHTILSMISMMESHLEASSVSWYTGRSSGVTSEQRAWATRRTFNHLFALYRAGFESNV